MQLIISIHAKPKPQRFPPNIELDLMTKQKLTCHLKICRRQPYNWRMFGLIPHFKSGKFVRSRAADVTTAIECLRIT